MPGLVSSLTDSLTASLAGLAIDSTPEQVDGHDAYSSRDGLPGAAGADTTVFAASLAADAAFKKQGEVKVGAFVLAAAVKLLAETALTLLASYPSGLAVTGPIYLTHAKSNHNCAAKD